MPDHNEELLIFEESCMDDMPSGQASGDDLRAEILASLNEQRASLAEIEAMGDQDGLHDLKGQLEEAIKELEDTLTSMGQGGDDVEEEDSMDSMSTGDEDDAFEDQEEEGQEEEEHGGLGLDVFRHVSLALEAGVNSETIHFAEWEGSSRGIASKLLSKMGYVRGEGLGSTGRKGTVDPVECVMLPSRRGLGGSKGVTVRGIKKPKKKSRGGERNRNKKRAALRKEGREARKDEDSNAEARDGPGAMGLFSFINNKLGDSSAAAAKIKEAERSLVKTGTVDRFGSLPTVVTGPKKEANQGGDASRRSLMQHEDLISAKKNKVQHFKAMLKRNEGNAALCEQIQETLRLAVDDLEASKAVYTKMQKSIQGKESSSKFWGKF